MVEVSVDASLLRRRLDIIKRERFKEAAALRIHDMVKLVAEVLGSEDAYRCDHYYVGNSLVLRFNCVHGASVEVNGRLVYDERDHRPLLYVPGTWVSRLINLHKVARVKAARERVKAEVEAIKREAERWGLTPEELGLCEGVSDA